MMLFLDTECMGFHGPIVLIQYAKDDGPIVLYEPWREPVSKTMALIESFCNETVVCFNLAFDWFHLQQFYNCLERLPHDDVPNINEYYAIEQQAWDGLCLKPAHCCDLMLHARKGKYQTTMGRRNIVVKRVPVQLAYLLRDELNARVQIPDICFAKKKEDTRWQVDDTEDAAFKNVTLRFAPSGSLKAIYEDIFGESKPNYNVPVELEELGYAPWGGDWNTKASIFISYWHSDPVARKYAEDDVLMTRKLYYHFATGTGIIDDDDSVLAAMIGSVRWHGFKLDLPMIESLRDELLNYRCPVNVDSSNECHAFVSMYMDDTEKLALVKDGKVTTKKVVLEDIATWTEATVCTGCNGSGCIDCNETGLGTSEKTHPAAIAAREILNHRARRNEIKLYNKLLRAQRFYPSFKVIGTKSNRMSGSDGLNPQGIKRADTTRQCFPLADANHRLSIGDFDAQEVSIADAVFPDPVMHDELLQKKKIHGLWGVYFFPGMTYDEILATKGADDPWQDKYSRSKNGVFSQLYFGNAYTLQNRVGISEEIAVKAERLIYAKYSEFARRRQEAVDRFTTMKQPGGIGTRIEWSEPADFVESVFGFKRYFSLENSVVKVLFMLAQSPPKQWRKIDIKVQRRDRIQSGFGAVQSALYAAAFAIQGKNMRAAGNHLIQSPGATITKSLQVKLWKHQPVGVSEWKIALMNIHDEVVAVTTPDLVGVVENDVKDFVAEYRQYVPLLSMDWGTYIETWAGK